MQEQVNPFIWTWTPYKTSKLSNHKMGICQSLSIPTCPWESISVDFVSHIFLTTQCHDVIFVSMCDFLKWLFSLPTLKKSLCNKLLIYFYQGHFGLPLSIIYERDFRLLNHYWKTPWHLLGYKFQFSTIFCPHTNNHTKVANHALVNALYMFYHMHN